MSLFDPAPFVVAESDPGEVLSYGRRLTLRAKVAIATGKHPANGLPINPDVRCGDCAHLVRREGGSKSYLKCDYHRLGRSMSEASDMRGSWPGCPHFQPR